MAAKVKNIIDNVDWEKAKLALQIGTPVVITGALAVWLYRRRNKPVITPGDCVIDASSVDLKAEPDSVDLSPLEKAVAAKQKGNKYFKGGKYEKAIECYNEAINLCPETDTENLSTFYQNRAAAFEHLNKPEKVVNDCDKALEFNSKYTKALFRRAKACESLKRYRECLEDVTAVCILEEFSKPESLTMAERVLKQLGSDYAKIEYKKRKVITPSKQYIRTYFSTFSNDPLTLLREKLKQDESFSVSDDKDNTIDEESNKHEKSSEDKSDLQLISEILEKLKDHQYEDILNLSTEALKNPNSPYIPEMLLLRGTFHLLHGESPKALEDLDELLKTKNIDKRIRSNAFIKRSSLKLQNGDQVGALSDMTTAAKEDSENSDVYHHRGQMNLLLDRVEDAVGDFQKSVDLNPDFAIANVQKCYTEYRLAFMCRSQLQLQDAMKSFEKQLKRFPKCAEGYTLYGQALCDQEQFEKADEMFGKATELEPENANLLVHRGLLTLQWRQDMSKAYDMIKKALEIDSLCEFAYETLGSIEVQRGNLKEAIKLFNKAIKLCKSEAELVHLYSLKAAAEAQEQVSIRFGISCSF